MHKVYVGVIAAVMASTSVGCSRKGEPLTGKQQAVLRVQLNAEPISLDPAQVEDGNGLKLIAQLREGLVGYDGEGKLKLLLAQSYSVSPDGKKYEFTLKPDLLWSDGQPVRVQDFVFGIRRAMSPESAGRLSEELMLIRGARDFRAGRIKPKPSYAPNDRSVGVFEENAKLVIELEKKAPYFLQALTLPQALPVRQDILAESSGHWSEDKAPGTGPYRFAAYQPGKRFLIEANPYYWGGQSPIGLIDFLFIPDESTALNLFESGDLDILTRVPIADISRLRKSGQLHTDPFFATYFISFNTKKAPFDDRDFRRAVSGSIRRSEIVRALDAGEKAATYWLPQGIEGFIPYEDPAPIFAKSVKKIRDWLAHHPIHDVAASFDTSARNTLILEKIQHDLLEALGMHLTLSNQDWKSYVKSIQTDPTPVWRFGWVTPYADPINPMRVFTTGNPFNYTGWSNAEYDRWVREIAEMAPGPEREKKLRRAQKIAVDDEAIVVPIYHYIQSSLVASRVSRFKVNPFGVIPFHELSLK